MLGRLCVTKNLIRIRPSAITLKWQIEFMKSDSLTKMVVHNKSLLFKKVRDNILFFVLSKGVAFLAPIFFLNFVSLEEYGVVEFSYALGSVLAVVAMLGLGGAYPYFVLRRGERDKKQVLCSMEFLYWG